jgi:hypothetical protein
VVIRAGCVDHSPKDRHRIVGCQLRFHAADLAGDIVVNFPAEPHKSALGLQRPVQPRNEIALWAPVSFLDLANEVTADVDESSQRGQRETTPQPQIAQLRTEQGRG